jgi:GNAT superfamily N-acetyltransferase
LPQPLIEALGKAHVRMSFSCGNQALDRYLREQANQDMKRQVATAFVLVEPPQKIVIGYYTLASGSLALDEWPEALARKMPRYPLIPVTLLGRLALDKHYQGRRLGQFLLMDALYRCLRASQQIASVAVIVDAINETARHFYQHHGFIAFPRHPRRLFLHMQTIGQMFR